MRQLGSLSKAAAVIAFSVASPTLAGDAAGLPTGFVYLRIVDPTIRQEIRYAGTDNFTGKALPGYESGECILRKAAAEALAQVQTDLAARRLGLKVFDCYRPKRAVAAMAEWMGDGNPVGPTKRYFPELDKAALHTLGYIARKSAHSTGLAVDLTLVRLDAPATSGPHAAGACTGAAATRSSHDEVDMGTGFDCFDPMSRTASAAVTADQHRSRGVLVEAMRRRGFTNYAREWWHFTYGGKQRADAFDFAITAPSQQTPK